MNQDPKIGVSADSWYYKNTHITESEPGFSVSQYKLDISIKKQLEVQANLILDENTAKKYEFTLYHGYKIDKITNESGQPLEFSQEGDYFSINSSEGLRDITITYRGSSPKFFSNTQGTVLPGWFAYYPQPGKLRMYNSSEQSFERILCPKNTEFSVNVNSKKETYCNLNENGDNNYSGISNGLTLVSGFYKTIVCEDVEVIYPYLETKEFSPDTIPSFIQQYKSSGILKSGQKRVFVLPNINTTSVYEKFCALEDHVTLRQFLGLPQVFEMQNQPSYKLSLFNAFDFYKKTLKTFTNSRISETVFIRRTEAKLETQICMFCWTER